MAYNTSLAAWIPIRPNSITSSPISIAVRWVCNWRRSKRKRKPSLWPHIWRMPVTVIMISGLPAIVWAPVCSYGWALACRLMRPSTSSRIQPMPYKLVCSIPLIIIAIRRHSGRRATGKCAFASYVYVKFKFKFIPEGRTKKNISIESFKIL